MLEIILSIVVSFLFQTSQPNLPTELPEVEFTSSERPYLSSKSYLLYDQNSQSVLISSEPNTKLPIASLTKLLTAHIILQENDLQEIVTVPLEATQIGGSTMRLKAGERITIENLLKGLLINSANDAAITLGIHNSESTEKFVEKMNTYANQLNMYNSHFSNPMGYDSPENYSTASDLLKLTLQSIQNPTIKEFSSIKSTTVTSQNGSLKHILKNTNKELENFQQINGLKTGTTNIAGQCLITTTNNETPQISIILGSSNRFQDTKTMLDWAKNNIIYTNDPSNI
jgi:D-alanyl-D-alanine carboxypeptidase (penicillin-binding protein 5/6)